MCRQYLGFVFLVWFTRPLHAQSAAEDCEALQLDNGYLVPEKDSYAHEDQLSYACEEGYKPIVEGWWATITCQNGTWHSLPQCIREEDCIPLEIPHAKDIESSNAKDAESPRGWYADGDKIRVTCEKEYDLKDRVATASCMNGTWSSVPVCERNTNACDVPPKIPHAVIVKLGYKELYADDSKVQYECEDGYIREGPDYVFCILGSWTDRPTCSRETRPGQGGRPVAGTGGTHTASADRGTQPTGGDRETIPGTGQGGHPVGGTGGTHTTSADRGTQPASGGSSTTSGLNGGDSRPTFVPIINCGARPNVPNGFAVREARTSLQYKCFESYTLVGSDTVVCYGDGRWSETPVCEGRPGTGQGGRPVGGTGGTHTTSADRVIQPSGGGSSTTSGLNVGDSGPTRVLIWNCGAHPNVPNGVAVPVEQMSLKYQCNEFYTLVGLDTVVCYSDGSWSTLPVCKEAFCQFDPAEYVRTVSYYMKTYIQLSGVQFVKEGEAKNFPCVWSYSQSTAWCTNGKLTLTNCYYPNECYGGRKCYEMLVQ